MNSSKSSAAAFSRGHYTTAAGLMGILKTGKLWATNIRFLNDEQEFHHALDIIRELLADLEMVADDDPKYELQEEYIDKVSALVESLGDHHTESIFTLSFSEKTDLLSQWRGYCPNNNGYCLTVDIDEVFIETEEKFTNAYLRKCVYRKQEKLAQLDEILHSYWAKYHLATSIITKNRIIKSLTRDISVLASHFKHYSFREEAEHRIIIIEDYKRNGNKIMFREGRHSLVPYLEIPLAKDHIKTIRIGPTSNKKLAKCGVEAFVETIYGERLIEIDIKVLFSTTPYRS